MIELTGIKLKTSGESNMYWLMRDGNWVAKIQMNGEMTVAQQEAMLNAMLAAAPASPVQEPADGRGTDAQIKKEREIARHAIVGALAAGYSGQAHPGADHWLAAAHDAGAQIKALEASAAPSQPVTLTDEVLEPIVKAIWDSGFAACRDTEIVGTHAQELAWGCVAANVIDKAERAIIAALREKEGK